MEINKPPSDAQLHKRIAESGIFKLKELVIKDTKNTDSSVVYKSKDL
jgi:hypothetical protein